MAARRARADSQDGAHRCLRHLRELRDNLAPHSCCSHISEIRFIS